MNTLVFDQRMLTPDTWQGPAKSVPFDEYRWLKKFGDRAWCRLYETNPSHINDYRLPDPYDFYVISFHREAIDLEWLDNVNRFTHKPVIILDDVFDVTYPTADNVFIESFVHWHTALDLAMSWYPDFKFSLKKPKFKASAICNRITQSKLLITTALLEEFGDQCMIRLSTWLEEKNVHFKQPCHNEILDQLSEIFWAKYFGTEIRIDDFVSVKDNYQKRTIDPNDDYLREAAVHFTNESLAYSHISTDGREYIYPGPFLTEKTLKCLLAGTAFVPVGQYNTYGALSQMGCDFAFPFDISWDQDPGNMSRLESIVKLIKWLAQFSADEIFDMVSPIAHKNFDHVWSGQFSDRCQQHNDRTIDKLYRMFS